MKSNNLTKKKKKRKQWVEKSPPLDVKGGEHLMDIKCPRCGCLDFTREAVRIKKESRLATGGSEDKIKVFEVFFCLNCRTALTEGPFPVAMEKMLAMFARNILQGVTNASLSKLRP